MEVAAKLRRARISAQKARLVADQIRGKPVGEALDTLSFSTKKGARLIRKLLESAIANAEHNEGADVDELSISKAFVDEGTILKRMKPRAKGRGDQIHKRTCHITLFVSDKVAADKSVANKAAPDKTVADKTDDTEETPETKN